MLTEVEGVWDRKNMPKENEFLTEVEMMDYQLSRELWTGYTKDLKQDECVLFQGLNECQGYGLNFVPQTKVC